MTFFELKQMLVIWTNYKLKKAMGILKKQFEEMSKQAKLWINIWKILKCPWNIDSSTFLHTFDHC